MADEDHHHIHELVIENHELEHHGEGHHAELGARLDSLEARIAAVEGREHRHEEMGEDIEVVEEPEL